MVSRLSRSLSVLIAVFVFSNPLGYKYKTESFKHHPKDWVVPANGRRSQSLVVFEIGLPGHTSLLTQRARNDKIVDPCRGVPLPKKLMTQARRHKAKQKAAEATISSGCPCKLRGFVGEEDD